MNLSFKKNLNIFALFFALLNFLGFFCASSIVAGENSACEKTRAIAMITEIRNRLDLLVIHASRANTGMPDEDSWNHQAGKVMRRLTRLKKIAKVLQDSEKKKEAVQLVSKMKILFAQSSDLSALDGLSVKTAKRKFAKYLENLEMLYVDNPARTSLRTKLENQFNSLQNSDFANPEQ